jgi:SAM-dependent methyltransferase
MNRDNFHLYSKYYDLLYRDKDYAGESEYVLKMIAGYSETKEINTLKILELGCGSGGHAAFMAPRVNELLGVERSSHMAEEAQKKNIANFQVVEGDATQLERSLPQQKQLNYFDAVVSLFHVVSYLNDNQQVVSCFNSAFHALKPGGVFVFDVWFTPAVYWLRPEKRTRTMKDDDISVLRSAHSEVDVMKNVVTVHFETEITDINTGEKTTLNEQHPMRCYSVPEIELLAKAAGFTFVLAEEFVTGKPAAVDTWGVCFLLKK